MQEKVSSLEHKPILILADVSTENKNPVWMEQCISSSQAQVAFSLRLSSIIEENIHKVKGLLGVESVLPKSQEGTQGGHNHIHMLQ